MKTDTLVTKLTLALTKPHSISIGMISLALTILENAKKENPAVFARLTPELEKLAK